MATEDAMDVESVPYMEIEPPSSDLPVARRTVADLLRAHKAEDIVPANSRVVLIDASLTVAQAFRALLENDVPAAPVIDPATRRFVRLLAPRDALAAAAEPFAVAGPLAAWLATRPRPFVFADASDSLLTACATLRDARVHRLPIVADGVVLHLLSHWRVLSFVRNRLPQNGRLFRTPVRALGIGSWDVASVRADAPLSDVLAVMRARDISAVPVVDARGSLVGVVSGKDVVRVVAMQVPLERAVAEFVGGGFVAWTCDVGECLDGVFERFETSRRHRLFVVDGGVVVGVVSLSDLLRYFLEGF